MQVLDFVVVIIIIKFYVQSNGNSGSDLIKISFAKDAFHSYIANIGVKRC